jgi:peptidoglycan/xylan/chitin deacetylase (PgdA/CDA1 family)
VGPPLPDYAAVVQPLVRLWSRVSLSSAGSILCFHGISSAPAAPDSPHVSGATLRMALVAARRAGRIISLRELVARHRSGRSTRGLVALTFDDAYASLLSADAEFLRAEGIPLTIFVTTEASRAGRAFWWDRIDELHQRAPAERWRAFEIACRLPDAFRDGQPAEYGPLRPIRQWILHEYKGRCPEHVDDALGALERDLGVRTALRAMTFDELAKISETATVELGVHTTTHPVLPLLSDDEMRTEVLSCLDTLREHFDNVVPVLAAPFGLFDKRSARIAREAGMLTTLTLGSRTLRASRGDEWLPRFCLCAGESGWKLQLRIAGAAERWQRLRYGPAALFPELPSATT